MPRNPRSFMETSFFHVMTQGINREFIFAKKEDILYYIKTMYKMKDELNIKIIAYCIMNNHAHLLVKTNKTANLSKYMQKLNEKYARYYNTKNDRVGYVFRDRYRAEGIYSEKQLYNCKNYIFNNPVKAGICTSPAEYPYSNYKKENYCVDSNYIFIDIEEDRETLCKNIINNFLKENGITLEQLKKNTLLLKKLLNILKNENKISLRAISKEIKCNREKLGQINKS